ncbi:hypothetical protein [Dyadobacter sp. Leaf189]|uniref:hypothetical protein n=1 Tax=Dyadobacter sp. Leaf189 TaxID=1736295 RepID=UPI0006FA9926|nr:hypothetical protein [Dyadobacter sp. Leaf189]KQS32844.1 hypothetical protein ASG33_01685 [Dyadobacter sp. Leaf189]
MIELPDDELDKLFRKSSEEFDPQYDPEDWNNLRKKLDQQDGQTSGSWLRKWWPLGLLLLLIPAGIVGYLWRDNGAQSGDAKFVNVVQDSVTRNLPEKSEPAAAMQPPLTNADTLAAAHTNANAAETDKEEVNVEKGTETELNKNANRVATGNPENTFGKPLSRSDLKTADVKSSPLLPRSRSKAGGVYLEPNRSKTGGGDGALILSETALTQRKRTGADNGATNIAGEGAQSAAAKRNVSTLSTDEQVNAAGNDNAGERMRVAAVMLGNRQPSWNSKHLQREVTFEMPEKAPARVEEKEVVPQAKWAVRFGYSPDLSTVGGEKLTKPGTAVSMLAELSVLPRLFVQTGAVWSRKDYRANAGDYILNPKWGYYTKPESIEGVCKVLEVPLNLRYDIVSGRRSRIFAGSGLSSYYMRGEKYKYNYEYPNDPHIKYNGWQGKTGWYLFSHLNASAGYEYRMTDKLSLVAEPYARMPLKRVGYGKVNLFTAGAWISVRYVPAFR